MSFRKAQFSKPGVLNFGCPLIQKVICAIRANEGAGNTYDAFGGIPLAPVNSAVWGAGSGAFGPKTAVINAAFSVSTPNYMRKLYPMSLFWSGVVLGTPTVRSAFFGISHNDSNTAPYSSFGVGVTSAGNISTFGNDGTTYSERAGTVAPTVGIPISIAAVAYPGTTGFRLFYNGKLHATGFSANTTNLAGPGYAAATTRLRIGESWDAANRNPNVITTNAIIVNRVWTDTEILALHQNPGQIWTPTRRRITVPREPISKSWAYSRAAQRASNY